VSFSGAHGGEAGAAASWAGNLSEDEETKGVGDFHRKSSGEASRDDQHFLYVVGIEMTLVLLTL